jgi:hypothetical protein
VRKPAGALEPPHSASLPVDGEGEVHLAERVPALRLASGGPRISAMKNAWRKPVGVVNMANTLRRNCDSFVSGRCSRVSAILFRLLPATLFTSG